MNRTDLEVSEYLAYNYRHLDQFDIERSYDFENRAHLIGELDANLRIAGASWWSKRGANAPESTTEYRMQGDVYLNDTGWISSKRPDEKNSLRIRAPFVRHLLDETEEVADENLLASMKPQASIVYRRNGLIDPYFQFSKQHSTTGTKYCFLECQPGRRTLEQGIIIGFDYIGDNDNKQKLARVNFIDNFGKRHHYCPDALPNLPFNQGLLNWLPNATVLLTDSIEIAEYHQRSLYASDDRRFVWCSWYSPSESIPNVDFSQLNGRSVYLILKGHSGQSDSQVYQNFASLPEKLKQNGVKDVKAVLFSSLNTMKGFSHCIPNIVPPANIPTGAFPPVNLPGRKRCLMEPLLYERSVTLMHGDSTAGSWLSLFMADAIASGKALTTGWTTHVKDAYVVYLYNGSDPDCDFEEKQTVAASMYSPTVGAAPAFISKNVPLELVRQFTPMNSGLRALPLSHYVPKMVEDDPNPIGTVKVVVIDGTAAVAGDHINYLDHEITFKYLKERGWTVILFAGNHLSSSQVDQYCKRVCVDNVIKIDRQGSKSSGAVKMKVSIPRACRFPKGAKSSFICEFNPNAERPKLRREDIKHKRCTLSKSERQSIKDAACAFRLNNPSSTNQEVMEHVKSTLKLSVSQSLIKKIISELYDEGRLVTRKSRFIKRSALLKRPYQ